jgi:hypothetical protein
MITMCDSITNYIDENQNIKSYVDIYDDLINNEYPPDDIKFVFQMEYDINVDDHIKTEYELREKRMYQQKLRKEAFKFYNNKCVISEIKRKLCLEVAHIKPVCECKNTSEKTDVENTLLLWIDLHKYFDDYGFSVNPTTSKIEINKTHDDHEFLKTYDNKEIKMTKNNKIYMEHHYDKFIKHIKN